MNIWFVKTLLLNNSTKLRFNFLKKLYIKIMYKLKYKYKYMSNLQLSFENLFILLECKHYKIELKDIYIRMNIKLKNIMYIDSKEYSIRLDVDKISWLIHLRIKDINTNNIYYLDYDMNSKDGIESILPKKDNLYKVYELFEYVFNTVFTDFIKE